MLHLTYLCKIYHFNIKRFSVVYYFHFLSLFCNFLYDGFHVFARHKVAKSTIK